MKNNSTKSLSNTPEKNVKLFILILWLAAFLIQLTGCNFTGTSSGLSPGAGTRSGNCNMTSEYLHPGGSGTGGTGYVADRGLGGTGIVGVITDFGSICVNGEKITYDKNMSIKVDGVEANSDVLRKGQFVSVYAINTSESLSAEDISLTHAIEGPLNDIQVDKKVLSVLGAHVKWNENTYFINEQGSPISPSSLSLNDELSVSGFWASPEQIVATRVDMRTDNEHVGASGVISQLDADRFMINKIPFRLTSPGLMGNNVQGRTAYISGEWTGSEIEADLVLLNLPTPYSDRAKTLNLEGYINKTINKNQFIMLGSVKVTTTEKTQYIGVKQPLSQGVRVWVYGDVNRQQQLVAKQIRFIRY